MKIDVVIIGGSLAGAACARELGRLGIEAVAIERDVFPRNKVCGGFLSPGAVDSLDALGIVDEVRAADAVVVDHAYIHANDHIAEIAFPRPGLGISRSTLDRILATYASVQQGVAVRHVQETETGFRVETSSGVLNTPAVVDAAGKLSRFTRRTVAPEFGVQYLERESRGSALDFWFFSDGYGGAVSIEGGQSNFCFLIRKEALPRYVSKPDRLVTGPISYARIPGNVIAIGDAAGMIDPFCGEGMHHALDSGITAARVMARGLRAGESYTQIRQSYETEWARRWSEKRRMAQAMRWAVSHPKVVRFGVGINARWLLERLWAKIPA